MNASSDGRHKRLKKFDVAEARKLRSEGWAFSRLGHYFGVSPTTVHSRIRNADRYFTRNCALPECGQPFKTLDPRQTYCRKKHAKLAGSRALSGIEIKKKACALPECHNEIWCFKQAAYCCSDHADLDWRRWRKQQKGQGLYRRLLFRNPHCFVCGEWAVVDEHHVAFSKNKSDKAGITVWLCPTHHMLIHRGLAVIEPNGRYKRLDHWIVAQLRIKQSERVSRASARSYLDYESTRII